MRPITPKIFLAAADTPAFLITNLTSLRYLTGLPLSDGILLVTPKKYLLFVDRLTRDTANTITHPHFAVYDSADIVKFMKDITQCGFESDSVSVQRMGLWKRKFKSTKFMHKTEILEEFRRTKDTEELKYLHRAERITKELLRRIPSALRLGITEEKLAKQLQIWALELGADGLAFDPIVAFGTHTSSPHHHPTSRSLKKGHIVQIDVGAMYRGYRADRSEVFFTGKPTVEQRAIYEMLCTALRHSMNFIRSGVSTNAVDEIARSILRKHGVEKSFTHALGHGVGLDIHEGVILSSKAPPKILLSGEVVAVEPGVYFPGKFGMRVEKMVFVS